MLWTKFVRQVGFIYIEFQSKYDFALSFAGEDRAVAEKIRDCLQDRELEAFYDKDEQHRILGEDVELYLSPIYSSEARFVLALLSKYFPKKIWTKFESEQFKSRFGDHSVIPIWFTDAPPGMFDESTRFGGMTFDQTANIDAQVKVICEALTKKVVAQRREETQATEARAQARKQRSMANKTNHYTR